MWSIWRRRRTRTQICTAYPWGQPNSCFLMGPRSTASYQEERKKLRLLRLSGRVSGMRITGSLPLPRRTWVHLTGWSAGRRTGSWEYIRSLIKYRDAAHPRSGSVKDTRIRGAPKKGTKTQPRKAVKFRGKAECVKRG